MWVLAGGVWSPGAGVTGGCEASGHAQVLCNAHQPPLQPFHVIFLRRGLSLNLELCDLRRLAVLSSRDAQVSVCLPLPSAGTPVKCLHTGFSHGHPGSNCDPQACVASPLPAEPFLQTLL